MSTVLPNVRYRTVGVALANGSKTNVYTAGSGAATEKTYAEIISVTVCASAGSAGTATLAWYDLSGTTEYVQAYQATVPAAGNVQFECFPLHLEPGDILRVTGAAAQHVTISMIEYGTGA